MKGSPRRKVHSGRTAFVVSIAIHALVLVTGLYHVFGVRSPEKVESPVRLLFWEDRKPKRRPLRTPPRLQSLRAAPSSPSQPTTIPEPVSTKAQVTFAGNDLPLPKEKSVEEFNRRFVLREIRPFFQFSRPLEVHPAFSFFTMPPVERPFEREERPSLVRPETVSSVPMTLGEMPRVRGSVGEAKTVSLNLTPLDTPPPTPGKQTLLGEEIRRVPGTTGDVLRAIEILPSVKGGGDLSGMLFIRGGGPEDNRFYLDRMPLGYPYHFGGITSTLSSEIIGKVDVHAGGFGAEFGNAQAVIDISTRESDDLPLALTSNVNLLLSEWYVGMAPSDRSAFYFAGRRTYADLIVPKIVRLDRVTAFPRFWDYQTGFHYGLSENHRLRLHAVGSGDLLRFILRNEDVSNNPKFAGEAYWSNGFHGQGATLESRFGERLAVTTHFSRIEYATNLGFGEGFYLRLRPVSWVWREDLRAAVHPKHTLEFGTEILSQPVRISANFVRLPSEEEHTTGTLDGYDDETIQTESRQHQLDTSAYLQDRIALGKGVSLSVGGRLAFFNRTHEMRFDPRLSFLWEPRKDSKIRVAWGIYSQPPEPRELDPDFGNPQLKSFYAHHTTLELEKELSDTLNLQLAFYRKDFRNLVTDDPVQVYKNQGTGFAQGMEMVLRFSPAEQFLGWLSYTHSVSKRRYRPHEPEYLYAYDQTHVATITASYHPNPNWELGAKWQYLTGMPFTPITGGYPTYRSDGSFRDYKPIYGAFNSERYPPFHRLDVRLARTFALGGNELQVYLEVLNAYNRKNALRPSYTEDYSERTWVYQLPLVPFLGARVHF